MNYIKSTAFSGTKNNRFTERNTDTIKNANVRKLTSIALMTIMVAGGLTFAIPGMEPAEAAQISSNPNLKVSAEGQNADNAIASTNIIEIIVSDGDVNASDDSVLVTVDGEPITMTFFSGAWYAYFADNDISSAGLGTDIDALVTGEPVFVNDAGTPDPPDPLVNLLDLDGEFDIVYEKPANAQTVTLDLDDTSAGVSLDRTNYSQGTDVVITIDDQALNVDPTDTDTWFFTTGGDPVYVVITDDTTDPVETNVDDIETQANAQITRDNAIAEAEADYAMATGDAMAIRDKDIADALADFNAVKDAIADLPSLLTYDDQTTPTRTAEEENRQAVLDRAEDTYQEVAGDPEATADSDEQKGSAQVTYELANADATVTDSPAALRATALSDAETAYTGTTDRLTIPTTGISGFETFAITDAYELLECVSPNCAVIGADTWVKFTEDDSNESTFSNSPDDVSSIRTQSDAQRGVSFSIEYDNTATSGVEYSTTNIVIDAGDEWNSGEEISITLTDSDANTNSLDANDLLVANAGQMLPIIEFGEPFTLLGTSADDIRVTNPNNDDTAEDATATNDEKTAAITADDDDTNKRLMLGGIEAVAHNLLIIDLGTAADVGINTGENSGETHVANFDVNSLGDDTVAKISFGPTLNPVELGAGSGNAVLDTSAVSADTEVTFIIHILTATTIDNSPIVFDIFSFGLEDTGDPTSNTNDAIYRLELEEDGDNSSDFIGTLEYIGLNQYNILNPDTYGDIDALGDSIILISDDDSISVEYLDLDDTGGHTTFTAEEDTPTHSGSVSLSSDGYKVADTVTVTVEDADLNVDSGKADIYTTYNDAVDSELGVADHPVLTVSIDDSQWVSGCGLGEGLGASQFTLRETGSDSGVFTGTFAVPANHCPSGDDSGNAVTVTGTDISAEYTDFRDDSGSIITVSASAGIRSNTGSVSLDRTVYPVPIGDDRDTDTDFATHTDATLGQHDLTVYVSINDADSDTSSNGIDSIDASTLEISVIRGSETMVLTIDESTIDETAPNSGIFEHTQTISYNTGPDSTDCPAGLDGCIVQGDILHVQYTDPSDASGSENTVTDSATFDLRNGVLQVDKPGTTGYVIGSDMIVTLIEQDLNLDSDATETYTLDLIEWDSDADTQPLSDSVFGATPSNLLETGTDTGIFQVVITVPDEIGGEALQRGEEITLTYNDWGPSGSDYVGDKDEEITAVAYTSDFGASIALDQKVYTWTDKVFITIVAPDHNFDSDQVDEIGGDENYPINIKTQEAEIEGYKLVETGADTGIFSGELILTGVENDDLDRDTEDSSGSGPTDGRLAAEDSDGLAIVFENSDGDIVRASAIIQWNVGEVEWLEASYPALGSGIVRVIDPDMNLNPEAVDNFDVNVWSDSDVGGISLTVTETNAATGIFEGTVFFDDSSISSGHRLNVEEGDTVVAEYDDVTSPIEDETSVSATTLIGTIVPPLERAPINNLRAVDTFDNSIGAASVGQQVVITADLSNGQDRDQDFIFLIQVQDENGITVSLNWVLGTLAADQSFSPGASWTPTEAGTYDVTAFVWESIDNPTALSPTATIAITVN